MTTLKVQFKELSEFSQAIAKRHLALIDLERVQYVTDSKGILLLIYDNTANLYINSRTQ